MKNKSVLGSLKYTFINKKSIKLLKLLLISTRLEKGILLMFVVLLPMWQSMLQVSDVR